MTSEDEKLALAALESHVRTGSLDGFGFVRLAEVLRDQPEEFWQRYFEHFNPSSQEAKDLLARVGTDARLSVLAALDGKALFFPDRLQPVAKKQKR